MIAAAVAPTTSVSTITSAWITRFANRISIHNGQLTIDKAFNPQSTIPNPQLEGLSDRKVHAPAPRLRLTVHEQARNRIQLPADVEAHRADRRLVAQPRSDGVAQVAQPDAPRIGPHVAPVEEQHAAEIAVEQRAHLLAER